MMTTKNIQACLEALGHPQLQYRTVHIGGTNGKGSTSYFLSQLLNQNHKVGMYVSPYFMRRFDNIWMNGKPIADIELMYIKYQEVFQTYQLTPFEEDTALAFLAFQHHHVDFAVIEVGLGGTDDATNVIDSDVVIITSNSLEHEDVIGPGIINIAHHQAGIIRSKKQRVIISEDISEPARSVFLNQMKTVQATMLEVMSFDVDITPLYQLNNLKLALTSYHYLVPNGKALNHYDFLPFRFEKVGHVIYDGAHNEEGIRILTKSMKALNLRPTVIMSTLKSKQTQKMIDMLHSISDTIYVLTFDHPDAIDEFTIKALKDIEFKQFDEVYPRIKQPKHGIILITGSLYFIRYIKDKQHEQ